MSEENTSKPTSFKPWGMETKQFCMFMHLSQFSGIIIPFAGIILPIIMWTTNKEQSDLVNEHGKNILNWMISCVIYSIVSGILCLLFIGVLLLIAIGICAIIFPIIGAVKSNNGEVYKYPLSIQFIK